MIETPDAREVIETLAAVEHERWSGWQRYLHDKCTKNDDGSLTISASDVQWWESLIATPYADLTERSKESDRIEARKTLAALAKLVPAGIEAGIQQYGNAAWHQGFANGAEHDIPQLDERREEREAAGLFLRALIVAAATRPAVTGKSAEDSGEMV